MAYNTLSDFKLICSHPDLQQPHLRFKCGIEPFTPFAPMLCGREWMNWVDDGAAVGSSSTKPGPSTALGLAGVAAAAAASRAAPSGREQARKLLGGQEFYIETKLDGDRILIHKVGDDVRSYTRNRLIRHDYATAMKQ